MGASRTGWGSAAGTAMRILNSLPCRPPGGGYQGRERLVWRRPWRRRLGQHRQCHRMGLLLRPACFAIRLRPLIPAFRPGCSLAVEQLLDAFSESIIPQHPRLVCRLADVTERPGFGFSIEHYGTTDKEKGPRISPKPFFTIGSPNWTRTSDPLINSRSRLVFHRIAGDCTNCLI